MCFNSRRMKMYSKAPIYFLTELFYGLFTAPCWFMHTSKWWTAISRKVSFNWIVLAQPKHTAVTKTSLWSQRRAVKQRRPSDHSMTRVGSLKEPQDISFVMHCQKFEASPCQSKPRLVQVGSGVLHKEIVLSLWISCREAGWFDVCDHIGMNSPLHPSGN